MSLEPLTLVYGLPKGETERYTEQLLASRCKTPADIAAVKSAAKKDGWHSFRVAKSDGSAPNFNRVLKRNPAKKKAPAAKKSVKRKSQITGKFPTVRLIERRAKQAKKPVKGYFPNPLEFIVQRQLAKPGPIRELGSGPNWETLASFSQKTTAFAYARNLQSPRYLVRVITA